MIAAAAAFAIEIVEAGGESLPCVRRGPADQPPVLIIPPLFEEMNRTRRLLALAGAALARHGIATLLPDLPGTGDHVAAAPDWERWRAALAALGASLGRPHVVAVRGGALLAQAVPSASRYLFAPARAPSLWRDLLRARVAADAEAGLPTTMAALETDLAAGETLELAGYPVTAALAAALRAASLPADDVPTRIVALGDSAAGADGALAGPPLWRQAEGEDAAPLAAALAADIADWLQCTAARS